MASPMINKQEFCTVFPEPVPLKLVPSQRYSWGVATRWAAQQSFETVPEEAVLLAFKNLSDFHAQVASFYADSVRDHFETHCRALFHTMGSGNSAGDAHAQIEWLVENIGGLRELYFAPMKFMELGLSERVVVRVVSALVREQWNAHGEHAVRLCEILETLFHASGGSGNSGNSDTSTGADGARSDVWRLVATLQQYGLAREVQHAVLKAADRVLKTHVVQNYTQVWDRRVLDEILQFVDACLVQTTTALCPELESAPLWRDLVSAAKTTLLRLRVNELYGIVLAYPHSVPALEEIKACLETSEERARLARTFSETVQRKLLHPGVNTVDIISCYILMIKSFLVIEKKGALLDKVCRQTRKYLKEKNDTIQYVVRGLLDNNDNNELRALSNELQGASSAQSHAATTGSETLIKVSAQISAQVPALAQNSVLSETEELLWVPDPVDALPDFKRNKVGDIVDSVISLFDSKNYFINEFLKYFSKQLLKIEKYNLEPILAKLELLKQKLENSSEFSSLDVMIKDIVESERLDNDFQRATNGEYGKYHATVVSYLFWPHDLVQKVKNTQFELPHAILEAEKRFAEQFEVSKANRKVEAIHCLGTVDLSLELRDRTLNFKVTPDLATVICLFDGAETEVTVDEICAKTRMQPRMVKDALEFWEKEGVVSETSGKYRVLETEKDSGVGVKPHTVNEMADSLEKEETDTYKSMEKFRPFINGMLTNLGVMNVEKMHNFLLMVVPKELNFACTVAQLEEYLVHLADEDVLENCGGHSFKLK